MTQIHKNEKLDWHMSKVHKTTISKKASKSDKMDAYAEWADNYEEEVISQDYSCPTVLAETLMRHLEPSESGEPLKILDAGCGTGLGGIALREEAEKKGMAVKVVGVDFSPEMLTVAERKNVYGSLVEADLMQKLPLEENSFDAVACGAVFYAGHCGPSALPNIMKCLKVGRVAALTIREQTYVDERAQYDKAFADSKGEVVENKKGHYIGPVQSHYVVLKKTAEF